MSATLTNQYAAIQQTAFQAARQAQQARLLAQSLHKPAAPVYKTTRLKFGRAAGTHTPNAPPTAGRPGSTAHSDLAGAPHKALVRGQSITQRPPRDS